MDLQHADHPAIEHHASQRTRRCGARQSRLGEYATEREVIRDGLGVFMARDRAMDQWLRDQIGPAYDRLKAAPSRAVTADHVLARLRAESNSRH